MSMQEQLAERIRQGLPVSHLDVINESHGHSVPKGSETHFKAVVVSSAFAGLSPVRRHQAVYALVRDQLAGGVHALALHTYTPEEWEARGEVPASPACHGGSKHDRG